MSTPHICLASDHAGFSLKQRLIEVLGDVHYQTEDMGPRELNLLDDYPDYVLPLAKKVATSSEFMGIVIGLSGEGEAMAANRIGGIRAALYYGGSLDVVKLSREHNDSNVLSLGARFLSQQEAKDAVLLFLTTPFSSDPRHVRRIAKFDRE